MRNDPELIIAVDTPDLPRAVAFYVAALGLRVLHDAAPEFVMVELRPGVALCLDAAAPGAAVEAAPRLIFAVADPAARERELAGRGLGVHGRSAAGARPWFSVVDPDGREVIFQAAAAG